MAGRAGHIGPEYTDEDDECGLCGQDGSGSSAEQREYWLNSLQDAAYFNLEDAPLPGSDDEVEKYYEEDPEVVLATGVCENVRSSTAVPASLWESVRPSVAEEYYEDLPEVVLATGMCENVRSSITVPAKLMRERTFERSCRPIRFRYSL
jgi:hypothetical protein